MHEHISLRPQASSGAVHPCQQGVGGWPFGAALESRAGAHGARRVARAEAKRYTVRRSPSGIKTCPAIVTLIWRAMEKSTPLRSSPRATVTGTAASTSAVPG